MAELLTYSGEPTSYSMLGIEFLARILRDIYTAFKRAAEIVGRCSQECCISDLIIDLLRVQHSHFRLGIPITK
jgi:hypothetical protein